jgi:hypothetical protein
MYNKNGIFVSRPERNVISHQPLLPGHHAEHLSGRGQGFKREIPQQLHQTFAPNPGAKRYRG